DPRNPTQRAVTRATPTPASMPQPAISRRQPAILLAASLIVLALAYGTMLLQFLAQQWSRPHYQYFPFVLGAFAWLLWRNSKSARPRTTNHPALRRTGLTRLLAIAWGLLAIAYAADNVW